MAERAGQKLRKADPVDAGGDDQAEFPLLLTHVWGWFCELMNGAQSNGMGPSTIAWPDIDAWGRVVGIVVEPWEARLIVRLSALRAEIEAERFERENKN